SPAKTTSARETIDVSRASPGRLETHFQEQRACVVRDAGTKLPVVADTQGSMLIHAYFGAQAHQKAVLGDRCTGNRERTARAFNKRHGARRSTVASGMPPAKI